MTKLKKAGLYTSIVLAVIFSGILTWSFMVFNFMKFDDSAFPASESDAKFFQETYGECRRSFLKAAADLRSRRGDIVLTSFPVPSRTKEDLTVDCCYIPARGKKDRLLIISSGVHGIEGFAGSAVQQMIMEEIIPAADMTGISVLLVHGVNAYGFYKLRRVTENNVDLNRNSDAVPDLFTLKNPGYGRLNDFLNPREKVKTGSLSNRFFLLTAISKIAGTSLQVLRQAILQGQYEYGNGIYFGGKDFESQIKALSPYLKKIALGHRLTLHLDLHTGYGQRGVLHLFPNPIKDTKIRTMLTSVFDGYSIDWGDSGDFYTTTGDFSELTGKLMPGRPYMPMTLEYGTMNSQTTVGSIKSLHVMILENQGVHFGFHSEKDRKEVEGLFREMYYPSSPGWRSEVLRITREMLPKVIERFGALTL